MRLLLITIGVILFLPSGSAIGLQGGDGPALEIEVYDAEIVDGRALASSCDVCSDGKVRSLKLRYDLPSATSSLQGSTATCVSDNYPERAVVEIKGGSFSISQGSKISISGAIGGNLEFTFDGWGTCSIDVSCSTPLVVGDKIGPFLVVAGNECNGRTPTKTTEAPVQTVPINIRTPTPAPTSGQTSNIQIRRPTGNPTTNLPCVVPDKVVYECGETITASFDYSQHIPQRSARIDDRIGIFPCYINTFKEAEVWQWECGAPPLDPQSCSGTRSKGTVVFNKLPGYNHGGQLWPLTANYNSQRQAVNRCFKIVILRHNGDQYTRHCESDGFTVNENSEPKCSIRLTSPTDDFAPKPTSAPPTAPVQTVPIDIRTPTPAPTSGQTSNIQIRRPTGNPTTNLPCVVPDKVVYECGETITASFDYSQHIPQRSARIDDRIGIFPCYINTFKEAEVWQWECGAPPLDPQGCSGTRSKGTVVFNKLPGYNHGGQLWPLTANYNSQRQAVNRCFKIVILRHNGDQYTRHCESDGFTVNENSEPKCNIRLTSPTDDFAPKPTSAPPTAPVQTVPINIRTPTPAPTSGQTSNIQIRRPTGNPTTNGQCAVPDKLVYECGETITASFDYSQYIPQRSARIDDRIGIFPCYINTFKEAEVWQWECGAPPLDPQSCSGTRSKGTVVFNRLPGYNHGGQLWPLTANYNSQRQAVNRCFKMVILRNNGDHYTRYCESDGFTVNENSEPKCSIRLTSPTDDFAPKPTSAPPTAPVQTVPINIRTPTPAPTSGQTSNPRSRHPTGNPTAPVQTVPISIRTPTPAPSSRQTSGVGIRHPTGNPTNGQCAVPDKLVYECGETITVRFDYSQHIPEGSARIDDRVGIFPCYIHTFKEAEVWQWACGAPPLDPQSCSGTHSQGTVVFNALPEYNNGGQLWPLTANYNSQRQEVNRCFKIVILRNDGTPYSQYCESDPITVNDYYKPGCVIRLTSPTDDF
ncbi:hypothetical protein MHU86_1619 [Fragilaria crotonensis]|nr:hypothetical protein MHU86_1619 [Fragilaria crotonensis]